METTPAEIVPGIYLLKIPIPDNPLGHLNCYVIKGDRGWMMVDTGWNTEEAFKALEDQLGGIGLRLRDINQIVVTHVHPDHYGLAGRIKQLTPARFAFHHWETALIEARYIHYAELQARMSAFLSRYGVPPELTRQLQTASQPMLPFVTVAFPDDVLYGVETLDLSPFHFRVLWTPGHSPGHICLYEAERHILLAGDHVLPTITPNISLHVQSGSNPLGDYVNSLRLLRRLPVDIVLPAHEHAFHDLKGRIAQIIEHHIERSTVILKFIGREPKTAYQVAEVIPWNVPDGFTGLSVWHKRSAVTEALAHLESLWIAGQLDKVEIGDVVAYKPAANGQGNQH